MNNETVKVEVWVSTRKVGSKCTATLTFTKEEFDDVTASGDIENILQDAMFELIEWNWKVVK